MISSLESSIVRMHTSDGARVGAGFLVGDGLVLTCAHVVSAALDISEDAQEAPANGVLLDFPLVEPEHTSSTGTPSATSLCSN